MTAPAASAPAPSLAAGQPGELAALLKRLHLANARRGYGELIERAEREHWSFHEFLLALAREEVAHRAETRLQRCVRKARFPQLKTVEEFDFCVQPELRRTLLGSCFGPEFVSQGRNLILTGRSGRGKTHLATAIAYRAIQNGFDALFATAAALIDDLSRASQQGRFQDALKAYLQPAVLVCDEVGYLSYGPDAANVLYHVVNARCVQRRCILFTTNKPLKDWGAALHDYDLAEAIIDRVLERGRILTLEGPSMRTRHLEGIDYER